MLGLIEAVVLDIAGFYRHMRPDTGPVIPPDIAIPWLFAVLVNGILLAL